MRTCTTFGKPDFTHHKSGVKFYNFTRNVKIIGHDDESKHQGKYALTPNLMLISEPAAARNEAHSGSFARHAYTKAVRPL